MDSSLINSVIDIALDGFDLEHFDSFINLKSNTIPGDSQPTETL